MFHVEHCCWIIEIFNDVEFYQTSILHQVIKQKNQICIFNILEILETINKSYENRKLEKNNMI